MAQPFKVRDVRLELEREVQLRKGVYPKWRESGKHEPAKLDAQLAKLEQAAQIMAWFEQHEEPIKWLFKNRHDLKALWTWWEKTKQEDEAVKALHENFPGLELAET